MQEQKTVFFSEMPPGERLEREKNVYALLQRLGIPFVGMDHPPALTIEDCAQAEEALNINVCKNLFLCNRSRTTFYLLLLRGEKSFRTQALSAQLGVSRLSFAPEEKMETLLGLRPGAVSLMGLMNDRDRVVNLLIDRDLLQDEYLGCHPCVNTASIKLRWEDVYKIFLNYTGHTPRFVEV